MILKKGFTLAEVLITLGIIGVVAAITAPSLVLNTGMAKVGPSLAKAVTTFENANQTMLVDLESNSITGIDGNNEWDVQNYVRNLSRFMKLIPDLTHHAKVPTYTAYKGGNYTPSQAGAGDTPVEWDDAAYTLDDGSMAFYIMPRTKTNPVDSYANVPSNQLIGEVYIDINGFAKPNKQAKDIFRFYLYNDGTLRAYGSTAFDRTRYGHQYDQTTSWSEGGCTDESTHEFDTCAGSIFENNMKVIYE